ncbi:DNA-polymerase IV [Sesbania bispinosa]|nr:DNA-polymerase IV [Sesbania bispinosa]
MHSNSRKPSSMTVIADPQSIPVYLKKIPVQQKTYQLPTQYKTYSHTTQQWSIKDANQ